MKEGLTNPKSWSQAIIEVGPTFAVIFALIALLGFLAIRGVPAIVDLTTAIQHNTDQNLATDKSIHDVLTQQAQNTSAIVSNQTEIITQHSQMQKVLDVLAANAVVSPQSEVYDADDRAALWRRHKQDQQRIDDLNKRLEKLEKK